MFLEPIIIFFLVRQMRKMRLDLSLPPQWNKVLNISFYAVPVLFLLQIPFKNDMAFSWVWHIVLLAVMGVIYIFDQFASARPVAIAFLPLAGVAIISDVMEVVAHKFYLHISGYLDIAFSIAFTWMVAMLVRSRKQQKALDLERKKTLEEEARNKFMTAQKAQLESLVAERTAELTNQKNELEHALTDLKSAQTQLIHSEKMASLGELTAGIAHEIQNPLNFVNNFSEVNAELIEEMKNELKGGNIEEAVTIAGFIRDNEVKITHHGKRADAIVKGMLQHSRKSTGQKEPTDINALADEYLRLSYHGLRAKDKSFNATMVTDFDESIGKISLVPQDMGRVLLNLFTNAFYSVTEKKNQHLQDYEPVVSVVTKKEGDTIKVRIRDNGVGIPQKLLDKIYQPFFSTKPTGQGTGLGLSLSYDIIKAQGGDIQVATKEGEFAEFTIILPHMAI
jgi:two-component system, NtrC family, sensor kinase